jgi:diamine N-acetyltransferase
LQKLEFFKTGKLGMISRATEKDYDSIIRIGRESIAESHQGSCSPEEMNEFLERDYNPDSITKELNDLSNIYHIIHCNNEPAGFSKIVLNASHPTIPFGNVAKLDRIYLKQKFYGQKLGLELLNFNIELSMRHNQAGMWLYTWVGNERAIRFYLRAGFTIIGSHKFYVANAHYDLCHHLFKSLS